MTEVAPAPPPLPELWVRGHGLCNLTDRFPGFDPLIRRLANLPRFGGDTPEWSVLHHSFLVGYFAGLPGFFHDFAEAWGFGDISTPCKAGVTRDLETRCLFALLEYLRYKGDLLRAWEPTEVKAADGDAMELELQAFFRNDRYCDVIISLMRRGPETLQGDARIICRADSYIVANEYLRRVVGGGGAAK